MKKCQHCKGTGIGEKIGAKMKALRMRAKLAQGVVASRMGINQSYLSDLENDNRNWSKELAENFRKSLTTKPKTKQTK